MAQAPAIVGNRLSLLNMLDRQMADDIEPIYTIELAFAKSPLKKVKAGAICVFKQTQMELPQLDGKVDPMKLREAEREASKQTESLYLDPIYFRQPEGRWVPWALEKVIALYDQVGGSARVIIKAPQLKIRQAVSSKSVAHGRSDLRTLFSAAWDIDKLLDKNFAYDPWTKKIRRGRIDAATAKRGK